MQGFNENGGFNWDSGFGSNWGNQSNINNSIFDNLSISPPTDNFQMGSGSLGFQGGLGGGDNTSFLGGLGGVQGIGSLATGAAALGDLFMNFKKYGLAEDELDFNRNSFYDNYAAQAKIVNERMNNLAIGRHAYAGNTYNTPADQMAKYGVDPAATKDKKRQKKQVV